MAIRPIVYYPDPILKSRAVPVGQFDEKLFRLARDMAETMYNSEGIGLAAPQIGVSERIIVVDVSEDKSGLMTLVNPEILIAEGTVRSKEGCLSIPEYRESIDRHARIEVTAQLVTGEQTTFTADGLLSICLQHEIDHLNGVLFIDHLSYLKKELFKKWWRKNGVAVTEAPVTEALAEEEILH